ncbi:MULTISPECIES: 1-hydroxycarotenoid 3,4-desaturase CrtD [Rhodomicrobium]|uniref:1-hydroxycarotenoid 3,4-desaturase CrtD n=1 Tax=Rhodomicrobium TaxID=1068 RepID=UPI000B4B6535|nr:MULTISPECIES: 1-hydroxycarotenoid 3,4-desaturase CrtD [Rhodomicrobium]
MRSDRVIIIGAGLGGLAAAIDLAAHGLDVLVLERAAQAGGKLRRVDIGGASIDAGPTVFTMRPVFEALFAKAGARLSDHLTLQRATTLARHGWPDGSRLDLFADIDRSADAIATFAGPREAEGYRRFVADGRRIYETLDAPFIQSAKPSLPGLVTRVAAATPRNLWCIQPYSSLWRKLGSYFRDPRLRQLFGRYSTYCGSSPFHAPATLMLIAHVEQQGVWLVEGGMHKIAEALVEVARGQGCEIRPLTHVEEILVEDGAARAVRLATGERIEADAIICNADVNAAASGAFGPGARKAASIVPPRRRSLSAMTWAMAARASGFPLLRHTVLFSDDYPAEFAAIYRHQRVPLRPTVYVCAQDRGDADQPPIGEPERLLCIVNAPALGDRLTYDEREIARCAASTFGALSRCGLQIERQPEMTVTTSPADFHQAFPATGGALYGPASHGWQASFRRAPARSRIAGLYFAGGSTHPGSGLPMAALSGRLAAEALRTDLALRKRFHPVAMPGGMSTA